MSTPTVTGAANGLSVLTGNVILGGNPLNAATIIDQAGNQMAWVIDGTTFIVKTQNEFSELAVNDGSVNLYSGTTAGATDGSYGSFYADALNAVLARITRTGGVTKSQQVNFDATKMAVVDELNLLGLKYVNDYNANQLPDDRAITDVGGVKALISANSVIGADNGLNVSAGVAKLGGPLTALTILDLAGFLFAMRSIDADGQIVQVFNPGGKVIELQTQNTTSGDESTLGLLSTQMELFYRSTNTGNKKVIFFNATGMFVADESDLKGLEYTADYTANQITNDRSITDVGGIKQIVPFSAASKDELTGQTVSANIITIAVAVDKVYRVSIYGINTAFTSGSFDINISYTDINGTPTTNTLATVIASNASDSAVIVVKAQGGANLTIDTVVTGILTYTAGAVVEALN